MASEERKEAFLRAWFDVPEGVHWAHGMSNEIEQNVSDCFDKAIAAWTTPVAPVSPDATGKCGELETVRWEVFTRDNWHSDHPQSWAVRKREGRKVRELVTRSQADELLAAERAEKARLKSENDAQADQISELQMTPWPEWATKVLAVIRKRSGYDGYGDAIEGVDLPAELDECIAAIEADNAALTARVKELEGVYERLEQQAIKDRKLRDEAQSDADLWRFSVDMGDHPSLLVKVWKQRKALEAKLAAAQKALSVFLSEYDELYLFCDEPETMVSAVEAARAVLGGKPS